MEYDFLMHRKNGDTWDNIYPISKAKNILTTDNSNVQNVTVDGQKIDEVHEIDVDGETYYLWIIYDLQTQNKVSDVIIE